MTYLIYFYFYAQDSFRYLEKQKNLFQENEIIEKKKKNIEEIKLLEISNPRIDLNEKEQLKEEWNKLKEEMYF